MLVSNGVAERAPIEGGRSRHGQITLSWVLGIKKLLSDIRLSLSSSLDVSGQVIEPPTPGVNSCSLVFRL